MALSYGHGIQKRKKLAVQRKKCFKILCIKRVFRERVSGLKLGDQFFGLYTNYPDNLESVSGFPVG